jgi:hypothetical protein
MQALRVQWVAAVVAAILIADAAPAGPFDELLTKLPDQTNSILFLNVATLRKSPLGVSRKWGDLARTNFQAGMSDIPPNAARALVAQHLDPRTLHHTWRIQLVQMPEDIQLDELRRREAATPDKIDGVPAVQSPRGSYYVQLEPSVLAEYHPADRQQVGRWIRFCRINSKPVVSSYLVESAAVMGNRPMAMLAVDLRDVFDLEGVRQRVNDSKLFRGERINLDDVAQTIASIRGLQIRVHVDNDIDGEIRLDFADSIGPLRAFVKPLILKAMEGMGAAVDDVENWTPRVENNTIMLQGKLTERGARMLLSPGDNRSATPVYADIATSPSSAGNADPKAAAAYRYFRSLNSLIDELGKDRNTKTLSKRGYWYQQYAAKIDALPILNVDKELLDFGATISQTLRKMAQVASTTKTSNDIVQAHTVDTPGYVPSYYGYGYGAYGNYGWYGGAQYTSSINNYQQVANLCTQNSVTEKSFREDTWRNITDAMAAMRRKMTEKYKMEF